MDHVDRVQDQWRRERPDLDVAPMGLVGRIKRIADMLGHGHAKFFVEHGLNAPSFDVLATLRRSGAPYALTPSELLDWTMVTSGTMTNRLDKLERDGLIVRKKNPKDGRGVVVALTNEGFARIDAILSAHTAQQAALIGDLSDDERRALDGLLRGWLERIEADHSDS